MVPSCATRRTIRWISPLPVLAAVFPRTGKSCCTDGPARARRPTSRDGMQRSAQCALSRAGNIFIERGKVLTARLTPRGRGDAR